jgi:hypothetical protein
MHMNRNVSAKKSWRQPAGSGSQVVTAKADIGWFKGHFRKNELKATYIWQIATK